MALLIYMSMPQCCASLELPHSSTGVWAQGNNARGQGSTFVGSLISFQCAWENKTEVERQDPYPAWWFVTDLSGPQHKHGGWLSFTPHMVLEKAGIALWALLQLHRQHSTHWGMLWLSAFHAWMNIRVSPAETGADSFNYHCQLL